MKDSKELAKLVSGRIVNGKNEYWEMNMEEWDWVPGVGAYGIWRAYEKNGDQQAFDYIEAWIERNIEKAYDNITINTTAPMLAVLGYAYSTQNSKYIALCSEMADLLLKTVPITSDGGFEHTVTDTVAFQEQMWADTLFMSCIFLARLGRLTGCRRYTEAAEKQLKAHLKFLSHESGLFYHGWDCVNRDHLSGALWGRANAWIASSIIEILEELPENMEGRTAVIDRLQSQVEAVRLCQRENGMFRNLLDQDWSYDEASATAGLAYAIKRGIKLGYLSEKYETVWKQAQGAVTDRIKETGDVSEVSIGTPIMPTLKAYDEIPRFPTLYGQGLTLLMLCEE